MPQVSQPSQTVDCIGSKSHVTQIAQNLCIRWTAFNTLQPQQYFVLVSFRIPKAARWHRDAPWCSVPLSIPISFFSFFTFLSFFSFPCAPAKGTIDVSALLGLPSKKWAKITRESVVIRITNGNWMAESNIKRAFREYIWLHVCKSSTKPSFLGGVCMWREEGITTELPKILQIDQPGFGTSTFCFLAAGVGVSWATLREKGPARPHRGYDGDQQKLEFKQDKSGFIKQTFGFLKPKCGFSKQIKGIYPLADSSW